MGVVLSEGPAEAGSACSEFLADAPQAPKARSTSLWFILLAPIIFPVLAIIECLPTTRAGWVILWLLLGPIAVVATAAAVAVFL